MVPKLSEPSEVALQLILKEDELAFHRGAEFRRAHRAFAQEELEKLVVLGDRLHEGLQRGADDAPLRHSANPRLADDATERVTCLLDQRYGELVRVVEMPIEAVRRDAGFACHLTQREAREAAVRPSDRKRRFEQRLAGDGRLPPCPGALRWLVGERSWL